MAEDEIIRQNKTDISAEEKERCVAALKSCGDFTFKSFLPVTENCHFERYNFVSGKDKLGIVYDTKAHMLSCTAKQSVLARVPFLGQPLQEKQPLQQKQKPTQKPQAQKQQQKPQKPPKTQNDRQEKKQAARPRNTQKPQAVPPDMPLEKPADKETKEPKLRVQAVPQERVKPPKQSRLKKGKQAAVAGASAPTLDKKVERGLKKLMPDAFSLLGAQSKNDFGIGMVDIGNDKVRLSDYSVLLVPPYRGLERFIYDLQQARGITVKMIGQAYEKDTEGKHVLKQCYRKKTGIVYSEVMSALYAEYFANRNFYAHSDNTDTSNSRMIADKSAAKAIFDKLCEIVNYNGKKLTEIGFAPAREN